MQNTNCLSLSFSEAAHAYSFHTKNFEILSFQIPYAWPKNFRYAKFYFHTTHNYPTMAKYLFLHINEGTHAMLDLSLQCLAVRKPFLELLYSIFILT